MWHSADREPEIIKSITDHYENQSFDTDFIANLSPNALTRNGPPVIMDIAPSVVAVSLFDALQRKIDCSGLIIGWDDVKREATILTSAKLLRFSDPENNRKFFHIFVRLANGKLLLGREDYVNYHHNLITVKVQSDIKLAAVELRSPDTDFVERKSVFALGRDFYKFTLVSSGGKLRNEYPYFGCEGLTRSTCNITEAWEGGPLISSKGHVCGINFYGDRNGAYPLLTPVFLPCLNSWRAHGTAVWPWFGLTVLDLHQLPFAALEKLGLPAGERRAIVKKVCKGSPADRLGVRPGYFIISCDGCDILSAKKYSEVIVRIAADMNTCIGGSNMRPHQVVIQRSGCDEKGEEITVDAESVAVDDRRFWYCWPGKEDQWGGMPLVGSQTGSLPDPWMKDFKAPPLPKVDLFKSWR